MNNNILNETEYSDEPLNNYVDDGYDSNDEIKIEITDCKNGNLCTQIYTVPYRPTHCNEKRLICFSTINSEKCGYGSNCTYAHSFEEQKIDDDKKFIYQIVLDKNLMNFFSMTNPKTDEIYKHLLFLTHICDNCTNKKCTGGYNCRNGVCHFSLKLCKNDLLTGECLNKLTEINVNKDIIDRLNSNGFVECETYKGCINGHHLTTRNLIPYYKYVHQKENCKKNKYHSVRYIDINPLNRIYKNSYNNQFNYNMDYNSNDSESSSDEEINSWFQKKTDSDDEWNDCINYNKSDN
ncbi:hypothetical protein QJ857_gp0772 [Tupanvirus soda lake]|uniref:C3H1-type domain-containing protein n=2 Tax=Tupanvirus TaxID=2094720 RepID=A0A6N1NUU0_9VIRU|nr:hypothetical protein QJ857_gp0772 [Tupanvirus soda lake]QKU35276.1 hypothetical protein [Tupanvirus soda lake]